MEVLVIGVAVGAIIYFWNRRKERSPNAENQKDEWMAEICPKCTYADVFKIIEHWSEPKSTETIKRTAWDRMTSSSSNYHNQNVSQNGQVIIEIGIKYEIRKCQNCGFNKKNVFNYKKEI